MEGNAKDDAELLTAKVSLPQYVVHRSFVEETVVLNLRTGKYHGLNVTAGRALELLETGLTVGEAARELAADYGLPEQDVRADVVALCVGLRDRGLVELR